MKTFIPHKDNPHTERKIMGAFVIVFLSAVLAYSGKGYVEDYAAKANALSIQEESTGSQTDNIRNDELQVQQVETLSENISKQEEIPLVIEDSEQIKATIEEAKAPVPIIRDKDPKKKIEEAKLYAKPQITEGKYIDVSLAHQNMVLFENGQYVDAYLISSGKRGMETPIGTFKIENKVPRAYSKSYGLYMPNWMALVSSGKFGIHELPEWPGGYKEGANHLGIPVSHGCVRLGVGAAKRVYDWSEVGTPVIIHK